MVPASFGRRRAQLEAAGAKMYHVAGCRARQMAEVSCNWARFLPEVADARWESDSHCKDKEAASLNLNLGLVINTR